MGHKLSGACSSPAAQTSPRRPSPQVHSLSGLPASAKPPPNPKPPAQQRFSWNQPATRPAQQRVDWGARVSWTPGSVPPICQRWSWDQEVRAALPVQAGREGKGGEGGGSGLLGNTGSHLGHSQTDQGGRNYSVQNPYDTSFRPSYKFTSEHPQFGRRPRLRREAPLGHLVCATDHIIEPESAGQPTRGREAMQACAVGAPRMHELLPLLQHGRSLWISEKMCFFSPVYCVARRKRLRRAGRSWGRSVGGISHLLGP